MQIAIVDDSAEDREELSVCLENYMKKHHLSKDKLHSVVLSFLSYLYCQIPPV